MNRFLKLGKDNLYYEAINVYWKEEMQSLDTPIKLETDN